MTMVLLACIALFPFLSLCNGRCGTPTVRMISTSQASGGARIVGGTAARPWSHPWIASMDRGSGHHCAGSLIRVSEKDETDILVTAAHCVYDFANKKPKPVEKYVTAGVHNRFGLSLLWTSQQKVPVKQAIWHEYYPFYDMVDIAILVLNGTIKFNDKVQPICLPPPGDRVQDGTALTVAGWGHTQENGQLSDVLLQVEQPVVTNEGCMKVLKQQRVLDFMICAGGHQLGGRDSCQGDSGGPAVEPLDDGTRYVLQGVVSFGSGCARPGLPGAYTRVSKYVDWIYSKVQEHSMVYKSDPTSGDTGFWSAVPDITDAMEDDEDYLRAENTSTNATVSGQGTSLTGRLKGWLSGVGSMVSSLASAIYAGLPTDIFSEFTDGDIDIVE